MPDLGYRPDKLGVVIDGRQVLFRESLYPVETFWEVWPRATESDIVRGITAARVVAGIIVRYRVAMPVSVEYPEGVGDKAYFFPANFPAEWHNDFIMVAGL